MKRARIIIVVVFMLLLASCNPVAEEIVTSPPPEVETPKPLASPTPAVEVLPPVGKNIFSNEWTDIYGFSISADPDGCAAILSDGSLVAFGSTAAGGGAWSLMRMDIIGCQISITIFPMSRARSLIASQ